jgi:hypothetical protein
MVIIPPAKKEAQIHVWLTVIASHKKRIRNITGGTNITDGHCLPQKKNHKYDWWSLPPAKKESQIWLMVIVSRKKRITSMTNGHCLPQKRITNMTDGHCLPQKKNQKYDWWSLPPAKKKSQIWLMVIASRKKRIPNMTGSSKTWDSSHFN